MRIMVAEDSSSMRQVIRRMLGRLGHREIVEAGNGAEAWERLGATSVDLLITDWNMPVMSGLELVQKVRQFPRLRDLPIIMCTTRNRRDEVLSAVQAGVNNYIIKPFTQQQLLYRIDKTFEHLSRELEKKVASIVKGSRELKRHDDFPVVVFAEIASTAELLGRMENRDVVQYLARAVQTLERINEQYPEARIGYVVENSPPKIMRYIRLHRDRLKLLLISAAISGGGVTLSRLARLSPGNDYTVCLVCDSADDLPAEERDTLTKLDILLLERASLTGELLERLMVEHVVAKVHERPAEQPAPDILRRRLETDIRLTSRLPVLPPVQERIARLARDRGSSLEEWARILEMDPLASAQVMRRARSPVFGFQDAVDTVDKAVSLLGKDTIKRILADAALHSSREGFSEKSFNLIDFWLHSTAVGLVARILSFPLREDERTEEQQREYAEWDLNSESQTLLGVLNLAGKLPLEPGEDPFVAGLFHDIGKVALAQSYPYLPAAVVDELRQATWRIPMIVAEQRATGCTDHSRAGDILARTWELDPPLRRVILGHHSPPAGDNLTQLVCVADFLAGAIRPFPRRAPYPHVRLLEPRTEEPPLVPDDEEEKAELEAFLPAGLLARLEMDLEELMSLGSSLARVVRRVTDQKLSRLRLDNETSRLTEKLRAS